MGREGRGWSSIVESGKIQGQINIRTYQLNFIFPAAQPGNLITPAPTAPLNNQTSLQLITRHYLFASVFDAKNLKHYAGCGSLNLSFYIQLSLSLYSIDYSSRGLGNSLYNNKHEKLRTLHW